MGFLRNIDMKRNNKQESVSNSFLILIKTNQTEKVKGILEKEKVAYEIYNSETNLKTKSSSKSKNDRARIKYLVINNK